MNHKFSDYYESNIKLLKKYHPGTWEKITQRFPEPEGTIFKSQNGKPNLTASNKNGKLITFHNEKTPEKDSDIFVSKIPADYKGFVAILGMGLGYAVTEILKKRPLIQSMAVFELDPGIFIQALRYTDLSGFLDDPRLTLCVEPVDKITVALKKASRTVQLEETSIYHHLPSFNYDMVGYNALKESIFEYANSMNIGGTTTRTLGKDFLNNRFNHLSTIHHHLLLENLHHKFSGTPAILVAGGPSLDKNIHLLKELKEKAVIVAVDTVLPILMGHGIEPHFLTSIDPINLTYEKFVHVVQKAKDVSLVCTSWINPRVAKLFPAKQIFWTFTGKPMESWLNSLLGGKIITAGASTVAHLNLITAQMLGCDPIIFVGQDLAYPGTVTHAKGAALRGVVPKGNSKNSTMGQLVKGINGKMLRTNPALLSMKNHFEDTIAKSNQLFINATEGGAHIEGTKVMSLEEVIDTHCSEVTETTRRINEYIETAGSIDSQEMLLAFNTKLETANDLQKTISKSDKIQSALLKHLKKTKKINSFSQLSTHHQKQINKNDKFHISIDKAKDVWSILEEITMDGLKESERNLQEIAMYKDKPNHYKTWLTKNLERLKKINKIRRESLELLTDNLNMVLDFKKKESTYIEQIQKNPDNEKVLFSIVRLYLESENYSIARPLLDDLYSSQPDSAELNFFQGCIAARYNEHDESDRFFSKAIKVNPALKAKIAAYQKSIGNEFLDFALHFRAKPGRQASEKLMLFKGLRYCPKHEKLIIEFNETFKKDLVSIQNSLETTNYIDAEALLNEWDEHFSKNNHVIDSIPPEMMADFLMYGGKLFLKQKNYTKALEKFNAASEKNPSSHDLHFLIIDTYFVSNDFDGAINSINQAISIDKKFAAYWETIGDSLKSGGQNEDAIIAYERCFTHLPENINLLKKLGDCYMDMGQLEAAKASYEQFKLKMGQ